MAQESSFDQQTVAALKQRKEERVNARVEVRVSGVDAAGNPFSMPARTSDISDGGGCVLRLPVSLATGSLVALDYGNRQARFQVVRVVKGEGAGVEAGLCCLAPDINFWDGTPDGESAGVDRDDGGVPQREFGAAQSGAKSAGVQAVDFAAVKALKLIARNGKGSILDYPESAKENFGVLAARLGSAQLGNKLKFVLVTSCAAQEGKSFIASSLAITMAKQTNTRVLLVDGNLRHPSLDSMLGAPAERGLGEWWTTQQPISSFIYRLDELRLWYLPAGSVEKTMELLNSPRLVQVFAQLAGGFDWVIIDSPAILPFADANLWLRLADAMLLVVRAGVTPRKMIFQALDALDDPKLLGCVLNEIEPLRVPRRQITDNDHSPSETVQDAKDEPVTTNIR